jgi:hypothetical protein
MFANDKYYELSFFMPFYLAKIQLPTFDKKPEESMTQEELNAMYGTADGAKKTKGK